MQRHAHKEQAQSERKWEIEGERERERDKCMHVYAIATVRVCVSGCESAIENCSATLYVCVCEFSLLFLFTFAFTHSALVYDGLSSKEFAQVRQRGRERKRRGERACDRV